MSSRKAATGWRDINYKLLLQQFYRAPIQDVRKDLEMAGWPASLPCDVEDRYDHLLRDLREEPLTQAESIERRGFELWIEFFCVYELAASLDYLPDYVPPVVAEEYHDLCRFHPVKHMVQRDHYELFDALLYRLERENYRQDWQRKSRVTARRHAICADLLRIIYDAQESTDLGAFANALCHKPDEPNGIGWLRRSLETALPLLEIWGDYLEVDERQDPANPQGASPLDAVTREKLIGCVNFLQLFERLNLACKNDVKALTNVGQYYARWIMHFTADRMTELKELVEILVEVQLISEHTQKRGLEMMHQLNDHSPMPSNSWYS